MNIYKQQMDSLRGYVRDSFKDKSTKNYKRRVDGITLAERQAEKADFYKDMEREMDCD